MLEAPTDRCDGRSQNSVADQVAFGSARPVTVVVGDFPNAAVGVLDVDTHAVCVADRGDAAS